MPVRKFTGRGIAPRIRIGPDGDGTMATLTPLRIVIAIVAAALPWTAAIAATVKLGLIDFALRHDSLAKTDDVIVRSMTFETSEMSAARFQSAENQRGHADVMARALIDAFQEAAPGNQLELYVASPFLQNPKTGQQVIDFEQLTFAYMWLARQGVKVVAQTFVAKNNPALAAAMETARDQGLIVLSSAGNGPKENAVPPFPASYPLAIGISTTALNAELSLEQDRDSYVRYSVKAPMFSALKLRTDPELAVLAGSSRATVAAAGYLGALATRFRVESREDATLLLDTVSIPTAQFGNGDAYGVGVLTPDLVSQHVRAPALVPELRGLLLRERARV
jgi:hypothetical protein